VFKAQAVLDDRGLIGQTAHVGPWSAEVILITDPEHAVPVRIERTGLRTIAVGAGDATSLGLPYLPSNADIKSGDLLVTSGLGGVFPEGYPVARVTEVHRDAVQPLAQVRAEPLAHVDTDSEVMLVWFRADRPTPPPRASPWVSSRAASLPCNRRRSHRDRSPQRRGRRLPRSPPGRDRRRLCRASSPPNHRLPNRRVPNRLPHPGPPNPRLPHRSQPRRSPLRRNPQAGAPHAAA